MDTGKQIFIAMLRADCRLECLCPAKINLTLAVQGKRDDGFHNLHSIVAQTDICDRFELEWFADGDLTEDKCEIVGGQVPANDNTVVQAIRSFRLASGMNKGRFRAILHKRIPVGAGLGGGSSDGVAALRALRTLFAEEFPGILWEELAVSIGSDCPLFLHDHPVVMEGRGELIRPLPEELARRLHNRPVILFKPDFSVNTAQAYQRLASGRYYAEPGKGERILGKWAAGDHPLPPPWNDFERLIGDWMPSLAVVLHRLRSVHRLDARMSGSGSACFVVPRDVRSSADAVRSELEMAWGDNYWMQNGAMK